jgi:uncharacterized phage protein (TIGR02220 family)
MAKYRPVHCSFWTDPKVLEEFTPEDKFFLLYLLTNEHTTQIGVYTITKKQMAFQMGYSYESINNLVSRFENQYKLNRYNPETRELALKHWGRYNFIKGGKPIEDCVRKEIQLIKDKELLIYVYENIVNANVKIIVEDFLSEFYHEENPQSELDAQDLDLQYSDENNNDTSTIRGQKEINNNNKKKKNKNTNNKSENSVPVESTITDSEFHGDSIRGPNYKYSSEEVISYLNIKAGTNYNTASKDIIHFVEEKIAEGYSFQDCITVIDIKVQEWQGTEYEKYLRPSTIFGEKFDEYLNQKSQSPSSNNSKNVKGIFSDRRQRNYDIASIERQLLGQE